MSKKESNTVDLLNDSTVAEIFEMMNERPIAYHRFYLHFGLDPAGGLFLSQACYWSKNKNSIERGGWFYKTMEEWQEEIGIGRRPQESARKKLRELGILEEKKQGVPAKLFFRVNHKRLRELTIEIARNRLKNKGIS